MPRESAQLADEFIGHLRAVEWTRSKTEGLISSGQLVRRDVERAYEGLYLESLTSFEDLIETFFLALLTGRVRPSSTSIVPRVVIRSSIVARAVVYGGRNYVDWLPYDHTVKRAKAFFRGGMPFTSIPKTQKDQIWKMSRIRNAIAHKSPHSMRMFEEEVIGASALPPRERTPAGYLRGRFRIAPPQTRFQNLASELAAFALSLCG